MNRFLYSLPLLFWAGCQSAPEPTTPLPAIVPPTASGLQVPPLIRRYTVGAYVDPDNPGIRYSAHTIHRVEQPVRWNVGSTAPAVAPTAEPLPLIAKATPHPAPEPPPILPPAPAREILYPDADDCIDLRPPEPTESGRNPFLVSTAETAAGNETELEINGIIQGKVPCALVNGQPLRPGDRWEALTMEGVTTEGVHFRYGDRLLHLPLARRIRVLLPAT